MIWRMNVDYVVDDIPVARMTNRPEKVHEEVKVIRITLNIIPDSTGSQCSS